MQKSLPIHALTSYPELGVLKLKPLDNVLQFRLPYSHKQVTI